MCQASLDLGAEVISVNRSGAPSREGKGWINDVRWIKGDIFKPDDYSAEVCFDRRFQWRTFSKGTSLHVQSSVCQQQCPLSLASMVSSRLSLFAGLQLSGATGVVSCVGAFGTDTFMEKICGDATVTAVEAAEKVRTHRC